MPPPESDPGPTTRAGLGRCSTPTTSCRTADRRLQNLTLYFMVKCLHMSEMLVSIACQPWSICHADHRAVLPLEDRSIVALAVGVGEQRGSQIGRTDRVGLINEQPPSDIKARRGQPQCEREHEREQCERGRHHPTDWRLILQHRTSTPKLAEPESALDRQKDQGYRGQEDEPDRQDYRAVHRTACYFRPRLRGPASGPAIGRSERSERIPGR